MLPPDDPETARRLGLVPASNNTVLLGAIYALLILLVMLATAMVIVLVDQWLFALLYGLTMAMLGLISVLASVWAQDPNFFSSNKPKYDP